MFKVRGEGRTEGRGCGEREERGVESKSFWKLGHIISGHAPARLLLEAPRRATTVGLKLSRVAAAVDMAVRPCLSEVDGGEGLRFCGVQFRRMHLDRWQKQAKV
jgi:hypothetical protein